MQGLARFDGVRFTLFDVVNTPELGKSWISALFEDREGNLWIGDAGGGLTRFKDGSFTAFTTGATGSGAYISAILEDREGALWVGSGNQGLSRLQHGTCTQFTTKDGLASDGVLWVLEDREGTLWIGTGAGLDRYKDGKFTLLTMKDGLPSDQVISIYEDCEGSLWIERVPLSGTPLGYLKKIVAATATRTLAPGERLVLMSDGIIEQVNGAGDEWGYGGVEAALAALCATQATPEEIAEGLLAACEGFGAGQPRSDDRTVVVLARQRATAGRAT
jgi:hypothetical protein